jgi:hypothetical protein
MERENKPFITPNNHTVVLRTYLNGKESRELNAIMYQNLTINAEDAASGKISLDEIPMAFMIPQQQKALEFLVVSVDGDTSEPLAKLEALPEADYNAVVAELPKIRVPLAPKS